MSQYKTGTATVTNASATVTGTGTAWLANVSPGDGFTIAGTGVPYTVASVESDTSLTLSAPYAGATASGQSYAVWRDFTTANNIPELSQGDIETATIFTRAMRLIDGDLSSIQGDYYNTGNILGTVSQSAGVPTGAIIESGSNGNGAYTKFADGTLICQRSITRDLTITSLTEHTLATSFTSSNVYVGVSFWVSPSGNDDAIESLYCGMLDTGTARVGNRKAGTDSAFSGLRLFAIGRWF